MHEDEEPAPLRTSRLHAVFSKIAGVLPKNHQDLGHKTMSSDIIETVLGCDAPIPSSSPSPPPHFAYDITHISLYGGGAISVTLDTICARLEHELRLAKRSHLACGEVLLPRDLPYRVAGDILAMAESEPCGVRGALIYLNFETSDQCRKLSAWKCDPTTTTTFELNLILRQASNGWNFLPQFIKNLARGGTVVVSPAYTLSKKKLYRSIVD